MKNLKSFIICDIVVILIKLIAGYFGHSLTLLSSIIYDLFIIITTLLATKANNEKIKKRSIFTSIYAFFMILISMAMIYIDFKLSIFRPSLVILIFLLICIITNYVVTVYKTNTSYMKREGLLGYSAKNSNINIIIYIITVATIILSKLKSLWKYFIYADRLGVILISLLLIYYALRIITRGFKNTEEIEEKITQTINEEVNKCKEVKNVTKVNINDLGGIRRIDLELKLQDGIILTDLITFIITIQDFLLKNSDLASVTLVKNVNRKVVRKNARNSGSTNSKGSTKKKNTKKKNKKR